MRQYTNSRQKRHSRVRARISGTGKIPRVSVYRSLHHLFVQLIDDETCVTLLGLGDADIKEKQNLVRARRLGQKIAAKALTQKIKKVVFDRNGYAYHGRIQALAEGLREGGLHF